MRRGSDDIVRRLRSKEGELCYKLCDEAASEIEKLQDLLTKCQMEKVRDRVGK